MGLGLVLLGALSMLAALGWAPGVDLASRAGRIVGAAAGAGMIAGGAGLWRLRGRVRTRRLVGMTVYVFFLLLMAEGVLQLASRLHPRWGFILSELPAVTSDCEIVFFVGMIPAMERVLGNAVRVLDLSAVAAALQDAGLGG